MSYTPVFTLYLPFTYAENDGKSGVTQQMVLARLQQLNWGTISQVQMQPPSPPLPPESEFTFIDKRGNRVRSWFVHYSEWEPPVTIDMKLQSGGRIDLPYDNLGHFWQLKKYIPREKLVKNGFTIQFPPLEKTSLYRKRGLVPPEMLSDYKTFDHGNDILHEMTWSANDYTLAGHLTEQEIEILDQTHDILQHHYFQNSYGLTNEDM